MYHHLAEGSKMADMRLDKLLSHLNCGSRKETQAMIKAGRVTVNSIPIRDPAWKVSPETATITLDAQTITYQAQRYFMLHKPPGVITATRDERRQTVLDLFPNAERRGLFAVGRLDRDTEGLLLLTDDGAFSHALASPKHHVKKIYEALVEGELLPQAAERFQAGLILKDGVECRPAELEPMEESQWFRITLYEGKYHQVKRMLAAVGGKVVRLRRVQIGELRLDPALQPGQFRPLTEQELMILHP